MNRARYRWTAGGFRCDCPCGWIGTTVHGFDSDAQREADAHVCRPVTHTDTAAVARYNVRTAMIDRQHDRRQRRAAR